MEAAGLRFITIMHVPVVPYAAFACLAGEELSRELDTLLVRPDLRGVVLYSDARGTRLALSMVGPDQAHRELTDVNAGVELDGLAPLCALRAGDSGSEGGGLPGLDEREREIARMEASLRSRERYLQECEHRMAEVGQNLSEREALLEHREAVLAEKSGASASGKSSDAEPPRAPRAEF